MTLIPDKLIVVDLEATCWEGYDAPQGQENEIIEIGLCLMDLTSKEIDNKRSILVRPERSVVSPFCTQLTSLTQEQVDSGVSFAESCDILRTEYRSKNRLWLSWGDYDRKQFAMQCKSRGLSYPFSKKHVNFKRLFQNLYGERMGIARAMKTMSVEPIGRAHRGDDDAWNTARLLRQVMNQYGDKILDSYW